MGGPGEARVDRVRRDRGVASPQRATPVLDPLPILSVGYVPHPRDAHTALVGDGDLESRLVAALGAKQRVWFVASRLRPGREQRIREILSRVGTTVLEQRRPSAFLVLVAPSPPPRGEPAPPTR
jgi:hypothetical protein